MGVVRKASVGRRKIHVDLPEDILRVKAALEDMSMQAFVARVVQKNVKDVPVPAGANHRPSKEGGSVEQSRIAIDRERIAEFCQRNHIHRLALFGSVLRDDFRSDSDLDVLVEFEPGQVPGLRFFALERELSEIVGRKVDLNTPSFLSRYFRDRVMAEAEVQYVAS